MAQHTSTSNGIVHGLFAAIDREYAQVAGLSTSLRRTLPRIVAIAGIALLLFAMGMVGFRMFYENKIYPAVVVGDVQVGGMTIPQAEAAIDDRASDLNLNSIRFTYGGQTWSPTLTELGITIDAQGAMSDAEAMGRGDDSLARLSFTNAILQDNQTIPLRTTIDQHRLDAWFDRVDADINKPAVNAKIVIDGAKVSFTKDATGIVVDRDAARAQIVRALTTLQPVDGTLPTQVDKPEVRAADLEKSREQVAAILKTPVTVRFGEQTWDVKPVDIAPYLRVATSRVDGKIKTDVSFDLDKLATYLRTTYEGQIDSAPTDATVAFTSDQGLIATTPSVDGASLRSDDFAEALAESYLGGHDTVRIPATVIKPKVDSNNLGALGIETMIGRGDSNFEGGTEERDTNIYVGAKLLNGELVAPGEDFSFNHAVGAITPDKGFVEAGVLLGEQIGSDFGGGICQVSTTVFRAAVKAGFPMVEWWPHTYRIQSYERDGWGPGYDASILQANVDDPSTWADFSFTNTTDSYILVQSWTSYPYLVVEIYGHDMGWDVTFGETQQSGPIHGEDKEFINSELPPGTINQTGWPSDGLVAGFQRTVTDANGTVISDRYFESDYKGHGNVYDVSPDMQGQSPAGKSGD